MAIDIAAISEIDDSDAIRIALFRDGKLLHAPLSTILAFATAELTAYGTSIANALYKTGDVKKTIKKAAESGWLLLDGKTIGSASSGGTSRANADTADLYALLWADWDNTVLPIQDSAGSPTTRGASAAADFAANKRLPLPDHRERVAAGWDNLADVTRLSSPVAGDTIGSTGGAQSHTLVSGEMPAHTHTGTTDNGGSHSHFSGHGDNATTNFIYGSTATGVPGSATAGLNTDGATPTSQAVTSTASDHMHTFTSASTGGDGAHNNVQPTIIFNYQVKL